MEAMAAAAAPRERQVRLELVAHQDQVARAQPVVLVAPAVRLETDCLLTARDLFLCSERNLTLMKQ